jgi:hypothetical protein
MKATIEFNLPDDQNEYELANNASKWYSICWDIKQEIRKNLKYNDKLTEEEYKIYEQLYDKLHELLNDNGLSL